MRSLRACPASDAVIVGAGPAGLATAIALRAHDVSVCVLEREPQARARIGETVPGDLGGALHALGAWDGFVAGPASAQQRQRVSVEHR
jgi:2-polyprenyl-6-methoxyphenol hydroxylase-like FAD-dependent oxidoreductase